MAILKLQRMIESMGGFCRDPGTLTVLSVGASILGGITGAASSAAAGKSAQANADYQAQIAGLQGEISQKNATAQQNELNYEAANATQEAGEQRAAAQQKEIQTNKQTALAQSRARTLAAAGGGGGDPSVVDIMGDLETEGNYNAGIDKFEGEDAARGLEDTAAEKTYEGKLVKAGGSQQAAIYDATANLDEAAGAQDAQAGFLKATSNIFSGAGGASQTLLQRYGSTPAANSSDITDNDFSDTGVF